MSEELENILQRAEDDARASAESAAAEARERANRPPLPPVEADPMPRGGGEARREAPQLEKRESSMGFVADVFSGSEPTQSQSPSEGVWRTFSTCDSGTITVWCQS
jgi:hypothetical protein